MPNLTAPSSCDILTDSELSEVTGVRKGSPDIVRKRLSVLKSAGIHCWVRYDGSVCTTWHHVHNAGQTPPKSLPNLSAIK